MKLKKNKTCGECRASVPRQYSAPYCEFNFKTKVVIGPPPFLMPRSNPAEPCPKPLTIKDYLACREEEFTRPRLKLSGNMVTLEVCPRCQNVHTEAQGDACNQ